MTSPIAARLLAHLSGAERPALLVDLARADGSQIGLSDVLDGSAPFGEAIRRDRATRGHLIGAGHLPLDAVAVPASRHRLVADALGLTYQHLVVDLGAVPDDLDLSETRRRFLEEAQHVVVVGSVVPDARELAVIERIRASTRADLRFARADGRIDDRRLAA